MAKLKGPLMSLGASGKLANTLVFFPWKGLNVVREYVVPANPDTTAQGIQRDYLKDAVAMVHTAMAEAVNPLTTADQVAYAALAAAKGKIMTWFNQACKLWIDVKVDEKIPVIYRNGNVSNTTTTSIDMLININEETDSTLSDGKFYFGTSKTNLIHSHVATKSAGLYFNLDDVDLSAFLIAGKKYFWQFRPDSTDPCAGADSGIYYFVAS